MSEQEKDPSAVEQEPSPELVESSSESVEEVSADPLAELEVVKEALAATSKSLAEADMRAQAEIQNMRRRMEREVGNAHKFALEKFSADLLCVADNLERGLAALPTEDEHLRSAREGVELTLKALLDAFARHGIESVDPAGASFDPQLHEAMAMVPMPGAEANSVIEVLEKGYSLNGRLIRPARVVVAKNP
ncbi:MAG: nucleotide exchange factor GrpE [Gammaproteobacteria bacterium HGW-Gammaproteobacteria-14]|nr:MAG: nucleotide exchange factor GrpE [Gammaproteobacteria bacterium HGW-Gammaproteobacteria-14]